MASILLVGCNGPSTNPVAPVETSTNANANGSVRASADTTSVNEWFQTQPPATPNEPVSTIESGDSRLEVLFNMCQATDAADPNAQLKFTYDFDSDGQVDYFGHCRQSHVYATDQVGRSCSRATVCISNRHDAPSCKQYDVCVNGGPEPEPTAAPTPTPTPVPRCRPTLRDGMLTMC
jgi:hypothetical protein